MYQLKILVVEDDIFIAQDIKECLESHDYYITDIAYQVEDALACLSQEIPDLVLLDINLGQGPDGVTLAQQLQTQYQIPFVYLTSYADKATLERVKPTRPLAYIVKPFSERTYSPILSWPCTNMQSATNHRLGRQIISTKSSLLTLLPRRWKSYKEYLQVKPTANSASSILSAPIPSKLTSGGYIASYKSILGQRRWPSCVNLFNPCSVCLIITPKALHFPCFVV